MKIIKETSTRDGKTRLTVELGAGERVIAIRENMLYRLGQPMEDDVVQAYIISEATPVYWCSIEQKWRDA